MNGAVRYAALVSRLLALPVPWVARGRALCRTVSAKVNIAKLEAILAEVAGRG